MSANPTQIELEKSYKKHKKYAATAHNLSTKLIWFYSAECGLKSYYLRINHKRDAEEGKLQSRYGHNLDKLLRDCSIPNPGIDEPYKGDGDHFPIRDFHEYMRYGATIPPNVETRQLEYIKAIVALLEEHL